MGFKRIVSTGEKITYHVMSKVKSSGEYIETGIASYVIPGKFVPLGETRILGKYGATIKDVNEVIIPSIVDFEPDYSGIDFGTNTIDNSSVQRSGTATGIYSVSCSGTCKVYLTDGGNEYAYNISDNSVEVGLRYMSGSCEVYRNKLLYSTLTGTFGQMQGFGVSGSCSLTGAKYTQELEEYKQIIDNYEENFEPSYDDLVEIRGAKYRIVRVDDRSHNQRGLFYRLMVERERFDR